MAAQPGFDRRALLKGGLAVTAIGTFGAVTASPAAASPLRTGAAQEPVIHDTAAWGARPPEIPIEVLDRVPTYIVVHHTVEPGNSEDYSLEHAYQISRDIQNFHIDERGWGDSGQQFTNSRGGHVTEGRHESLAAVRSGAQHVVGANVGDHNSEVIGIENEGLYTDVDVPQALWDSLVGLVAWIASQYGISPDFIRGHRDFNSTECPGQVLYDRIPELKEAVGAAMGVTVRTANEPKQYPLLKPGERGENVRLAQRLLRERGYDVPADGLFGASTRAAVARFADANNVASATCRAAACRDERGLLGADIWPLLGVGRYQLS